MLIRWLPLAEFAIFFLCSCRGIFRGGSDGCGGVLSSGPSLARDDIGCHGGGRDDVGRLVWGGCF